MEEKNTKNKSFLGGTMLLGAAGLVIKFMGAAFRIPLANIIGATGMGYYQKAYPIYNLFLTIAIAGIPTAIARMVAERNALDKPYEAHRVFKASFVLLLCTGIITSSLMFFGAEWISSDYLGSPKAVYSMKAISLALLFCPLMSSFRGFFQGRQNMRPTAVSQLVEQLFRVAAGLGLAVYLLPGGVEYAAAGASFGAAAGGIAGFAAIGLIYLSSRKKIFEEFTENTSNGTSAASILKEILLIAVPITIGSAVLPIMNTIDMMVVEKRLLAIGYSAEAANSLYGELTGFAQPLINFPQVITQAVSISMVPLVASAFKRKEYQFMQDSIRLGIRYALIIAIPCAVGMSVLSEPILILLYPSQRASAVNAAPCLAILAVSIVFLGVVHTFTGILQGVGRQSVPVINLAIGAVCKVAVTYIFTGIPSLNVKGAAMGTLIAYAAAAVLDYFAVLKYTKTRVDYILTLVKPLFSAAVMGLSVYFVNLILQPLLGNALSCALSIGVGVIVYFVIILSVKAITLKEIEGFPKGKRISAVLGKFIK